MAERVVRDSSIDPLSRSGGGPGLGSFGLSSFRSPGIPLGVGALSGFSASSPSTPGMSRPSRGIRARESLGAETNQRYVYQLYAKPELDDRIKYISQHQAVFVEKMTKAQKTYSFRNIFQMNDDLRRHYREAIISLTERRDGFGITDLAAIHPHDAYYLWKKRLYDSEYLETMKNDTKKSEAFKVALDAWFVVFEKPERYYALTLEGILDRYNFAGFVENMEEIGTGIDRFGRRMASGYRLEPRNTVLQRAGDTRILNYWGDSKDLKQGSKLYFRITRHRQRKKDDPRKMEFTHFKIEPYFNSSVREPPLAMIESLTKLPVPSHYIFIGTVLFHPKMRSSSEEVKKALGIDVTPEKAFTATVRLPVLRVTIAV